jgi:hypothetical protein
VPGSDHSAQSDQTPVGRAPEATSRGSTSAAGTRGPEFTPAGLLTLQRRAGNRVVLGVVARERRAVLQRQQPAAPESAHLHRNRFNVLPTGALTPLGDASPTFVYQEGHSNEYRDAAGLLWELQPDWKSKYHQPPGHETSAHPYPNKKFLHRDASGGSSEAILQPDGTYLTTGPLRGTYNYTDPTSLLGWPGHFLWDILPHYGSQDYVDYPALDPRTTNVDTYRQRWEAQLGPIGQRSSTNVTDPVDRTIVEETGVVWIQHASGEVLVLAKATNGQLRFLRFIDSEFRDQAIARAQARQPRGLQHIPATPPYIFDVPATVPANAARP